MKNIDTLFLSGGGINSLAIVGVFQYLFDNNIITPDLSGIKNIICVSGSSFYILPLLLGYSVEATIKICLEFDSAKIVDYTKFDLNNIFNDDIRD